MTCALSDIEDRLNLSVELIDIGRPNRPGTPIRPRYVTIHNTSNTDAGADASAHSRFVRNKGYYMHNGRKNWVSWHFTVDDERAFRHLPINEKGWHAGRGNGQSVGVEICMNDGIDQDAANRRAALLTAMLLRETGEGVDRVITHKEWTGKGCPTLLLGVWDDFIALVESELVALPDGIAIDGLSDPAGQAPALPPEPDLPPAALQDEPDIDHEAMSIFEK